MMEARVFSLFVDGGKRQKLKTLTPKEVFIVSLLGLSDLSPPKT